MAPGAIQALGDRAGKLFGEPRWISLEQFKAEAVRAQLFVRTGEATPYANAILRCGVLF